VDAVLTTTELLEMVRLAHIDPQEILAQEFDEPYRQVTGAGVLFGATGGVAEAALRMAVEKVTGQPIADRLEFTEVRGLTGFKEANVKMGEHTVRLAVIAGLKNAIPVLDRIKAGKDVGYDLIEVMTCPGGCIGGAGHPVPTAVNELKARQDVLVNIDRTSKYRTSQSNPDILRLYEGFYKEPNSELAHRLLHTHYVPRGGDSRATFVRNKADSAFRTHEIEVCICNACSAKGAAELFDATAAKVKAQGLDAVVDVQLVRLSESHPTETVHVTMDGRQMAPEKLESIYKLLKH